MPVPLTYEDVLLTAPIVIGIVGVPETVMVSEVVMVKSKFTFAPEVPMPAGDVNAMVEIVGTAVSIVRVVLAPVRVGLTVLLLAESVMVPVTGDA